MENIAKASNLQLKPSLIPRAATVAKQPSPKEKSEGKSSLYAASGTGLRLCAPKTLASFVVDSTSTQAVERKKLKVLLVTPYLTVYLWYCLITAVKPDMQRRACHFHAATSIELVQILINCLCSRLT